MAAPYFIGSFNNASLTAASASITVTNATSTGDGIAVACFGSEIAASGITDSQSNTYSIRTQNTSVENTGWGTATSTTSLNNSGNTITVTFSTSLVAQAVTLVAYGIPGSNAFDTGSSWITAASGQTSASTTLSGLTVGDTVIGILGGSTASPITPNAGYTQIGSIVASSTFLVDISAVAKQNCSASETPGMTWSTSGGICFIAGAFKVPAIAVAPPAIPLPLNRIPPFKWRANTFPSTSLSVSPPTPPAPAIPLPQQFVPPFKWRPHAPVQSSPSVSPPSPPAPAIPLPPTQIPPWKFRHSFITPQPVFVKQPFVVQTGQIVVSGPQSIANVEIILPPNLWA